MPRRYDCPACHEPIVTWMRPEEAARCPKCGTETTVPEDAEEVAAPPRPVPSDPPALLDRKVLSATPASRARLGGLVLLAAALLFFLVGLTQTRMEFEDTWTAITLIVSPFLFLSGFILIAAGLVARTLERIRKELARRPKR